MKPHDHEHDPENDDVSANDERDALLTAYALGETDDAQTAEVEALLANDVDARATVDAISATAVLLSNGLAAEEGARLPTAARELVTAAAVTETATTAAPAGRSRSMWPLVAMAASVVAGVGIGGWLSAGRTTGVETAESRSFPVNEGARARTSRGGSGDSGAMWATPVDGVVPRPRDERTAAGAAPSQFSTGGTVNYGSATTVRVEDLISPEEQAELSRLRSLGYIGGAGGGGGHATAGGDSAGVGGTANGTPGDPNAVTGPSAGSGGGGRGASKYYYGAGGGAGGGSIFVTGGAAVAPDGKPIDVVRDAGGGYLGPGGEVPPESKSPSSPPAKPGLVLAPAGAGSENTAVEKGGTLVLAADATAVKTEQAQHQLERIREQLKVVLEPSRFSATGAGGRLETIPLDGYTVDEVAVIRRFVDAGEVAKTVDLPEAVAVYTRVLADARRIKAERFRDRHGLTYGAPGSEDYAHPGESIFRDPAEEPLSTFSIDVDTASYANVRRFLNNGQLPPPAAVRVEEMVNYFTYSDPLPQESEQGEHPIAATLETATCPWNTASRLVRVGIKARTFDGPPPAANLVFLIDVSGSMQPADKLPLLQRAMKMLTEQMREQDRVAIVTYASNSGVALQSTTGAEKLAIGNCISLLSAGGSTNGGSGIIDAYRIAREHFIEGGINRVILATDGDFNVGVTDRGELTQLIEKQRESGVFLSVLGVGTGNLKDATLERLADRGNGNYHYLDGLREARKVLVDDLMGTVATVAKDVKIQIEFNPVTVGAYRLIGYENRMLAAADFNDDTKDAGEMGAGHTVTALYEIVPAGRLPQEGVDPLRYQKSPPAETTTAAASGELLTLKVRYKQPDANESTRFEMSLKDSEAKFDDASEDLRFASAVASFGMLLRGSRAAAGTSYDAVLELAQGAIGSTTTDRGGHRAEFLDLVLKAKTLSGR